MHGRGQGHRGGRRAGRVAIAAAVLGALVALGLAVQAATLPSNEDLGLPAGSRPVDPPSAAVLDQLRTAGLPFGPGERLQFAIQYGPIKAGTATLELRPMFSYRGRSCYHIVSQTQSAPVFDRIYKVRDRIDTLIDSERFITWQYRKVQNEGSRHAEHQTVYDHDTNRARYADGVVMRFPPRSVDALGAFYFTRTMRLEPGTSFYIPHHSDKKTFYLQVKVLRRERVKVPAGTFDCVVIEPLVRDAGPFRNDGRLDIWVTDDARHLPVLMKSKVPVGSIDAALERFVPGGAAALAQRARTGA